MIPATSSKTCEKHIAYQEIIYLPTYVGENGQIETFLLGANIILSMTAFLKNSLILVALNKESSLH